MNFLEKVGLSIQRIRRSKSLSQEKVAHDAEIDQAYLSRIEAGRSDIGLQMLMKIARALDVQPADILQGLTTDPIERD
jgi:transcriptional regulator with XRE-family HTH domain